MVMTMMIKLVLTNVSLKLDISTVDSCNFLKQALTLIFVMTLLTIFTITATEIRIKHRKHNRWKRRSLSTHRYYIYGTKRRSSRIGIKRHLRKLYLYSYLFKSTGNHVAFSTSSTPDPNHPSQVNFDTDSFIIGVDNHASRTLSNNKRHFIGYIRRLDNVFINGINGKLPIRGIGTIQWKIEDDDGKVHAIRIPNTFYVPQLEHCILSPQH